MKDVDDLLNDAREAVQRRGKIDEAREKLDPERQKVFDYAVEKYISMHGDGLGYGIAEFCDNIETLTNIRVSQNTMRRWLWERHGFRRRSER